MSETTDKKYTLAKPGGSITAININGSVDVFGKSTKIRVREIIGYPIIDDEPKRVANEDDFWANIKIGTIATAVLAGAAIVVAVTATTLTGGAALAVFVLGGAATGTGLLTATTAVTDYNTGCARSTDVFVDQLIKCGVIGAFAGAACYFMPAVAPKVGAMMGDEICTLLGISTASTGAEVIAGGIAKVGYVAIAGRTAFSVDQVCTMGSGESILLDTLFQGNQNAYDCSYMICETIALGYFDIYMQYGTTRGNQSINGDSDGDEETGIPYKNSNNNNSSNNNSSNNNNSNSKGTGQNNTSNVKLNSSVQGDADDSAGQSSGNAAKSGLYLEESGSKTIDDIIDNLPETTNGKGVARNFESTGGFDQTIRDFDALNPIDVKEIQTQYGPGKVGKLSDGTTVVARPGSTTGGATLEIRVSNSKVYKIRY